MRDSKVGLASGLQCVVFIMALALIPLNSSVAQCGGNTPVKCLATPDAEVEETFVCCPQESNCAHHPISGQALCAPKINSLPEYDTCVANADREFQNCVASEDGQVAYLLCQFIRSREPSRDPATIPACVEAEQILNPCFVARAVALILCTAGSSHVDLEADRVPSLPPGFGQPKTPPQSEEPDPNRPRPSVPPELFPFTA
jgi:hypothetical protein